MYIKLCIVRSSIMTFPYMHVGHFDHIPLRHYSSHWSYYLHQNSNAPIFSYQEPLGLALTSLAITTKFLTVPFLSSCKKFKLTLPLSCLGFGISHDFKEPFSFWWKTIGRCHNTGARDISGWSLIQTFSVDRAKKRMIFRAIKIGNKLILFAFTCFLFSGIS